MPQKISLRPKKLLPCKISFEILNPSGKFPQTKIERYFWKKAKLPNTNNQKLCIFLGKIKQEVKYFLFFFLIFWLSLSNSDFQSIKLIKLFTKYKIKLLRVTMVSFHETIDMCQLFYEW